MTKPTDFDVTIGVRVRLTTEQKALIKENYDRVANEERQLLSPGRGGITVQNNTAPTCLIRDFGCDRVTLASLLASSERHTISQLKRWERVLGIELVDKKTLENAWKSYLKNLED